uniref:G-protein coupled receptors family 1 profile domain-containing protein n=1 Tax=Esox lucius TaxID=8010 RepID=A0AAY5K7Z6_ESOLU
MEMPSVANTSQLCASDATLFILPSLYILIFLTGLPGNALSLWVFLWRIPNQTSTHVYLTHLGLSNLLLCLTAPFQAAYYVQAQTPSNELYNKQVLTPSNDLYNKQVLTPSNDLYNKQALTPSNDLYNKHALTPSNDLYNKQALTPSNDLYNKQALTPSNDLYNKHALTPFNDLYNKQVLKPSNDLYNKQGQRWSTGSPLCKLVVHWVTPVQQINIYVGVFILTWVALSRFATLIQHTHASRPSAFATLLPNAFFTALRRPRFAKAVCAGVWVVVVGAIVPVAVYYSVKEANAGDGTKACYNFDVEAGGRLSRGSNVAAIVVFFVCFILVMTSYVSVARHVRRSRQSAAINGSQRLLGKVFRNIVVIQVVLIVCLLPHHIFKSIFISIVEKQEPADLATTGGSAREHCLRLSAIIEVKNFLLCLASLRCSADPVMYFLLDKTFYKNIRSMFRLSLQKPSSQSLGGTTSKAKARANGTSVRLKEACHKDQGSWKDSTTVDWSEEM